MLAKPLLVFSSYALLFALLAIRLDSWTLKLVLGGLSVLGVLALIAIFMLDSRSTLTPRTVARAEGPGPEAGAYLVSYLLPFVVSPDPAASDLVAYGIFLVVAGVITASTGAVQINPLLYLSGRRIIRVTDSEGYADYVVIRKMPIAGEVIWVTRLQTDVSVMRRYTPVNQQSRYDRDQ
ncbi:hypothetical protein [Herbiconiux sp.]|uniref:hypothetical protein n=1 Tax=Herbiconiux sp. TaxID=1871186 RepID=UPI0025BBD054|nr:hypothetical protein [Herbiconiux sp.]